MLYGVQYVFETSSATSKLEATASRPRPRFLFSSCLRGRGHASRTLSLFCWPWHSVLCLTFLTDVLVSRCTVARVSLTCCTRSARLQYCIIVCYAAGHVSVCRFSLQQAVIVVMFLFTARCCGYWLYLHLVAVAPTAGHWYVKRPWQGHWLYLFTSIDV